MLRSIITIVFLSVTIQVFAQTKATLAQNMVLSIPVDSAVIDQYVLDITAVPFTTADQMESFFQTQRDDVVDFIVNKTDRTVYMVLNLEYISRNKWAQKDINRYLEAKAPKMREVYLTFPVDDTLNK